MIRFLKALGITLFLLIALAAFITGNGYVIFAFVVIAIFLIAWDVVERW